MLIVVVERAGRRTCWHLLAPRSSLLSAQLGPVIFHDLNIIVAGKARDLPPPHPPFSPPSDSRQEQAPCTAGVLGVYNTAECSLWAACTYGSPPCPSPPTKWTRGLHGRATRLVCYD